MHESEWELWDYSRRVFLHIGNDGHDGYNIWWNLQKSIQDDSSNFEHFYQIFIKTKTHDFPFSKLYLI